MEMGLKNLKYWHPLCRKKIEINRPWPEHKHKIERVGGADEIEGLLHSGFNTSTKSPEEDADRIKYYLSIAFGYRMLFPPFTKLDKDKNQATVFGEMTAQNVGGRIAQKAFSMLCLNFFKDSNRDSEHVATVSWLEMIKRQDVFEKVLWFFLEPSNVPSIESKKHTDKIALDFLYNLCVFSWGIRCFMETIEPPSYFVENRESFIKILFWLGKEEFLIQNARFLSRKDVAILRKIVLNQAGRRSRVKGKDSYLTIFDAMEAGEPGVNTLIVLEKYFAARERKAKI